MILVTGASGFVGSAVVRQLLKAGHQVRALVRSTSSRINLADLRVEIVEGDLRDVESLVRAMAGIRFVFHVAADYRLWARLSEAASRRSPCTISTAKPSRFARALLGRMSARTA